MRAGKQFQKIAKCCAKIVIEENQGYKNMNGEEPKFKVKELIWTK